MLSQDAASVFPSNFSAGTTTTGALPIVPSRKPRVCKMCKKKSTDLSPLTGASKQGDNFHPWHGFAKEVRDGMK
eukprot:1245749-Lingulodinium_polyedra.AAC.1